MTQVGATYAKCPKRRQLMRFSPWGKVLDFALFPSGYATVESGSVQAGGAGAENVSVGVLAKEGVGL
jgi:hypothetical protein